MHSILFPILFLITAFDTFHPSQAFFICTCSTSSKSLLQKRIRLSSLFARPPVSIQTIKRCEALESLPLTLKIFVFFHALQTVFQILPAKVSLYYFPGQGRPPSRCFLCQKRPLHLEVLLHLSKHIFLLGRSLSYCTKLNFTQPYPDSIL